MGHNFFLFIFLNTVAQMGEKNLFILFYIYIYFFYIFSSNSCFNFFYLFFTFCILRYTPTVLLIYTPQ